MKTVEWIVYQRRNGSLGVLSDTKRGRASVAACTRAGGKVVHRGKHTSSHAALAAARRELDK
jgi:hypothetical protein